MYALTMTYVWIAAGAALFFGLITGGSAQGRDRDGAIWFLLGAVFGPFALIAVLIFKRPER
jgi:hypothetical protein